MKEKFERSSSKVNIGEIAKKAYDKKTEDMTEKEKLIYNKLLLERFEKCINYQPDLVEWLEFRKKYILFGEEEEKPRIKTYKYFIMKTRL